MLGGIHIPSRHEMDISTLLMYNLEAPIRTISLGLHVETGTCQIGLSLRPTPPSRDTAGKEVRAWHVNTLMCTHVADLSPSHRLARREYDLCPTEKEPNA